MTNNYTVPSRKLWKCLYLNVLLPIALNQREKQTSVMFSFIQKKKKPCLTIEYNHTQFQNILIDFWKDIAGIKQALVIDWLNLFSQQLATVSASLNKRNLDLSSWDFFFVLSLQCIESISIHSSIYRSKPRQKSSEI